MALLLLIIPVAIALHWAITHAPTIEDTSPLDEADGVGTRSVRAGFDNWSVSADWRPAR